MQPGEIVITIIGSILVFVVLVYIMRAIFSIGKILKAQKAQVQLLLEIAKKMDADRQRLESIVAEYKSEV